jgi:hypothetical protein
VKKRDAFKREFATIRGLVNAWDPIGLIACGCPEDEYDCITNRLLSLLYQDASDPEIQHLLLQFIPEHFGVPLNADVLRFNRDLRASWARQIKGGGG